MSSINPSSSIHASVPPKAGPTSLATIDTPPPAVSKLATGTVIIGTVVRQEPNGKTFLQTEHGQLTLTTRLPMPTGTEIKIEVHAVGARMQAIVLSIAGKSVANAATLPAAGTPPQTASAQSQTKVPAQIVTQPSSAQVASSVSGNTGVSTTMPQGAAIAIAATLVPHASIAMPSAAPIAATDGHIPLRIAMLSLQVPEGTPSTTMPTIPLTTTPAGGAVLAGNVIGMSRQGGPVLQTSLGQLTLLIRAELPTGTAITFELLDPPSPRAAKLELTARTALQLSAEWASLKSALEILGKTDPAIQATLMNATLPTTGKDMVAKLFHFFSALSKGDIRDWLGERTLRSIESAGKGALAQKLSDEFIQLSRLALRGDDEWRTILFPILHESEMRQAKLFLRHHESGDEDTDAGEAGTRIIVEVSLSHLGELQLDGLYHARRFDVILRTLNTLPVFMTTEIRSIFENCCKISGLKGDILFRTDEPFAPTPLRKANNKVEIGLEA
ncbi:hypothetical protein JYT88_00370 [Rhodospirillaceae bacterium AH-315-P19]|nr:hypothetical protein [Rhodospirillaceae bacterium AH-315-P19]